MASEIANKSHAGLVIQIFDEEEERDPVINASWGLDVATLRRVGQGSWSLRLTTPLSLAFDPVDVSKARFSFLVTAQPLALPNYVNAFVTPDPFATVPIPPPVPGGSIQFGWVTMQILNALGTSEDADAAINLEVRRIAATRS